MPQMAESITEGILKSWLKQFGDTDSVDEEAASIETDKIGPCSIVHGDHGQ